MAKKQPFKPARSPKLRAILDAANRRINEGAGISHDAFWQGVETAQRARQEGNEKHLRRPSK